MNLTVIWIMAKVMYESIDVRLLYIIYIYIYIYIYLLSYLMYLMDMDDV